MCCYQANYFIALDFITASGISQFIDNLSGGDTNILQRSKSSLGNIRGSLYTHERHMR